MDLHVESVTLYHGFCHDASTTSLTQRDQCLFLSPQGLKLSNEYGNTRFQITFSKPQSLDHLCGHGPRVAAVHFHAGKTHLELGPSKTDQQILASLNMKWEIVCIDFEQPSSDKARCFSAELLPARTKLASNHDLLRELPDDVTLNCKDGKSVTINGTVAKLNSEMFSAKERVGKDTNAVDLTDFTVETVTKVKGIMLERVIPHEISPDEVRLMHYILMQGRESAWKPLIASITVNNCLDIIVLAHQHNKPKITEAATQFFATNIHMFTIADPLAAKAAFALKNGK